MRLGVGVVAVVVSFSSLRIAQAQTPQPQHQGRVTIANGVIRGVLAADADAAFSSAPLPGAIVGSDGPCIVYQLGRVVPLAVGTISITGTTQPITLEQSAHVYKPTSPVASPAFVDGATITIDGSGGADLPGFTAAVTAPTALTGFRPPSALRRNGYTATWTAGPGPQIQITIVAVNTRLKQGVAVVCSVEDTGAFTVPASTFGLIPSADDHVDLLIARVAETVQTVGDTRVAIDAISIVGAGPFVLALPLSELIPAPHPEVMPQPERCETAPRKFLDVVFSIGGASRSGDVTPHAQCETSPVRFINAAFGNGGVSRIGNVPPTQGSSLRLQFGQRLGHRLHLVEETTFLVGQAYVSSFPTDTSEEHVSFGAGVRWELFEPRPLFNPAHFPGPLLDLSAFYVAAIVGADGRSRATWVGPTQSTYQSVWSPMESAALGWLPIQGHDWALGEEFREELAYYDHHVQRSWMSMIVVELRQW